MPSSKDLKHQVRRFAYRFGRAIYMRARGDVDNDMGKNGELFLQHGVLNALSGIVGDQEIVFFDVGANVGDWSTAVLMQKKALAVGRAVKIYCFEPVPATFKALENRLAAYHPSVRLENAALSSRDGATEIFVQDEANAGTNSLHDDAVVSRLARIPVQLVTAAHYCDQHNIAHVHLMKCDTEGHDMEVIRGALPLLQASRISVLQFEYNHRWVYARNFLRDAFLAIESLPYRLAKIQPDHVVLLDTWHPELERFFEGNYLLIHEDAMTWLPSRPGVFDQWNTLTLLADSKKSITDRS